MHEYGMVCMRYNRDGLNSSIKVWNPFLNKVRDIQDPSNRLARQTISAYAFGYTPNTDDYAIVHVFKRHIRDRQCLCHVYSSSTMEWSYRYVIAEHFKNLGSNSMMYKRNALWVNWVGRQFIRANDIVMFDVDQYKLQKTKIKREDREHFQCLAICGDQVW
ncbi:hypothetical protein PIB30_011403 [Stylosanthes scabra]|uniref:F-box associated beta-propeller type 1 domain-containing protein n=1 Tax=Stylosanthes scabra TaxID=79078 RepID=A0ABU6Z2G1_9FABA|nr:hypothetical protein [Stylosanthes scabra]